MKPIVSTIAALAVLSLPASAVAQDQACLSSAENRAVMANLMPALVEQAAKRCAPVLDGNAYLTRNSAAIAARQKPYADKSWPAAKPAFQRLVKMKLPDNETVLEFGRQTIASTVARELTADQCGVLSRLMQELAPLPPENFAHVVALFVEAGSAQVPNAPIRVCEKP
ncbi:hypothetical protein [Qipengyuania sp. JC766]|uniref:hypothetical protein n=1 Tax=Qipengyuania sp. JC766 TaxID=3232139 RepID=UPI003459E8E0